MAAGQVAAAQRGSPQLRFAFCAWAGKGGEEMPRLQTVFAPLPPRARRHRYRARAPPRPAADRLPHHAARDERLDLALRVHAVLAQAREAQLAGVRAAALDLDLRVTFAERHVKLLQRLALSPGLWGEGVVLSLTLLRSASRSKMLSWARQGTPGLALNARQRGPRVPHPRGWQQDTGPAALHSQDGFRRFVSQFPNCN